MVAAYREREHCGLGTCPGYRGYRESHGVRQVYAKRYNLACATWCAFCLSLHVALSQGLAGLAPSCPNDLRCLSDAEGLEVQAWLRKYSRLRYALLGNRIIRFREALGSGFGYLRLRRGVRWRREASSGPLELRRHPVLRGLTADAIRCERQRWANSVGVFISVKDVLGGRSWGPGCEVAECSREKGSKLRAKSKMPSSSKSASTVRSPAPCIIVHRWT